MDAQRYTRLLNYVICELTMPVKKHIFNFVINDQNSKNHHLLAAAAKASKSQKTKSSSKKLSLKHLPIKNSTVEVSNTVPKSEKMVEDFVIEETLCEEKDMDGGTFADIHLVDITDVNILGMPKQSNNVMLQNTEDDNIKEILPENSCHEQVLVEEEICLEEINNTTQLEGLSTICHKSETSEDVLHQVDVFEPEDSELSEMDMEYSQGVELLDDKSNSCSDISGLYSDPLLLCSEADFKIMFRMTRTSFQKLLEFLSKEEMEPIENIPLYKKVLMVLWLMGNSGSYCDAAQVFSVTEEAAANCFYDVCATLFNKSESVIKWPSSEECIEIASRIEKTYGFPGVVGILGCHYFSISIPKEALARREHFNAKHRTYCIALQIVCDDRLVIRDIFAGLPGSTPEAHVLRDSPLCEQLTSRTRCHQLVEPHKHVLARAEYPQLMSMLTPYTKTATTLSNDELEFNQLHENVCTLVDQTFQMLKDQFLTLKLLDSEVATMVLVAACVLHNICVENGDFFETQE